jgi:PAS domain-containing protein
VAPQHPLELILARNLIATIALAAFLVDDEGTLVFFNTTAGSLIGRHFEEVGRVPPDVWMNEVGPFDELGKLIQVDNLPMATSLRKGLPANGRFRVRLHGELTEVDASGLPLVGRTGIQGAIVVFWEANGG